MFTRASVYLASLIIFLNVACQKPPAERFTAAERALEIASKAEAPRYANNLYSHAESLLTDCRLEIAHQTGRFIMFRNYDKAESLLVLTVEASKRAAEAARGNRQALEDKALDELASIKDELLAWQEAFNGSLIIYEARQYWASADLAVKACTRLIKKNEYDLALKEAAVAKSKLQDLSQFIEDYTNSQAGKKSTWRKWVRQTVDNSRQANSPAIIVVKSSHKLYLLNGGKIERTYDCELGYNSSQQKYFAGDGATPEGVYKITRVNNGGSKFYKALMLNYPNENDKRRFAQNKANGIISQHAKIGALIEIHGHGGQAKDWTNGCVALTNEDMDRLVPRVGVGTLVTIVRVSDEWP